MAARLAAVLPRFAILTLAFLLGTATLTFAAQRSMVAAPAPKAPAPAKRELLVVPDVRGQAYVFAKGMLEDGGFAWRVEGSVRGFAANTVASQTPPAGTRVVDTGAPTIRLRLRVNPGYAQRGTPEDAAPFIGTAVRLADVPRRKIQKAKPVAAPKPKAAQKHRPKAAPKPKPAPKPAPKRPPAFAVPGAPAEPLREMSLPARARRLEAWLSSHRRPTSANVRAYLYQHSWIVTGAQFGWWRGAEALRILIRVDARAQRLWGIGAKSRGVARQALRQVDARSR